MPAFASDVATIMSALKDEASECRYYDQLCTKLRAVMNDFDENHRLWQQSLGGQRDPDDTFYRDRGHALMASMEKASADIHTGRDVMIAKHPTRKGMISMPTPTPLHPGGSWWAQAGRPTKTPRTPIKDRKTLNAN